jgi:hypothetical protein
VQVNRWQRYGNDRLYVEDSDGVRIGWWNLADGSGHPGSPEREPLLVEAVREWLGGGQPSASQVVVAGAVVQPAIGSAGPDFLPPPAPNGLIAFSAHPPTEASTSVDFPPPQGPPVVTDLFYNRPGEQLAGKVEAARLAGERPTLWRRFWLGKNAYSTWERGMIGEQLVAQELDKLVGKDPRWHYLNSIPVGDNVDIDTFVIGPGGIFSINAKYHRGARIWVGGDTIMVNGTRQPYVRNSRHEARRASRLLSRAIGEPVTVQGLVVPVAANTFTVREQPKDVYVINRVRLARRLRSLPDTLNLSTVQRVFDAARLSSTWMPSS